MDGTQVHSSVVLSNATPYKTFMVECFTLEIKHINVDLCCSVSRLNVSVVGNGASYFSSR